MDTGNPYYEGHLTKQGHLVKNWKRRWCILQNYKLGYFKTKEDDQAAGMIPLAGCIIRDISEKTGKKFCFEIRTKERSWAMYADSQAEYDNWTKKIAQAAKPVPGPLQSETPDSESIILSVKGMMCEHCEGRVRQILTRTNGAQSFNVDCEEEVVTVTGRINLSEQLFRNR